MYSFSRSSLQELGTCHIYLQQIAHAAIEIMDFSVVQGYRGEEEQNHFYSIGTSRVQYPDSAHNSFPSLAFDIYPYPIFKEAFGENDAENSAKIQEYRERQVLLAGILRGVCHAIYSGNIGLIWGGDWDSDGNIFEHSFQDLAHFELDFGEPAKSEA